MDIDTIFSLVTIVVTLILGIISKKYTKLSSKLIPIQNLLIGIIVAIINFAMTKDFNASIMVSGLTAGGLYDIGSNLKRLTEEEEE